MKFGGVLIFTTVSSLFILSCLTSLILLVELDFLKVLSNNSWAVGFAVGKDFSHLQRAKFYRWIFPLVT